MYVCNSGQHDGFGLDRQTGVDMGPHKVVDVL